MQLLFFLSVNKRGGAEHVMVNLANRFCRDGQDVTFVMNHDPENGYPLDPRIKQIILKTNVEDMPRLIQKGISVFRLWNMIRVRALRACISELHPDLVISFMHGNDVMAYRASKRLDCKLLLSVRNDPVSLYASHFLLRRDAKRAYRHADAVVFQTEEAKDYFSLKHNRTRVIFNQIGQEFYDAGSWQYNRDGDIVSVGRFVQQKNHKMLMKAFMSIADQISNNLVLYGDGQLREEYEKFIEENKMEDRIFLPGVTDHVPEVLQKSSLFVLSSDHEGTPNALMEAMAVGMPCIATDCPCGGPRRLNDSSDSIEMIAVGDEEMLAQKMLFILQNKDYALTLADKAKQRADCFNPDQVFAQWEEFIAEIINS